MREQVRACFESMFNHDEIDGSEAPGVPMAHILPSPLSLLPHTLRLLASRRVCHCSLHLLGQEQDFFPCSHKHFDYLRSSASSGKIIMSFHELLQMDCDFDLMICNNGVRDFAMSATGLE